MIQKIFEQKIDTFNTALGDDVFNSKESFRLSRKRWKNTIKFIDKIYDPILKPASILDVAGPSILGIDTADYYNCSYASTLGNIDRDWCSEVDEVELVLMMEVLEHILNPLKFLEELKEEVEFKNMVITWPSRPSFLWTNIHYHELRLDRFKYLCELAGYDVVYVERKRMPESWWNKFKGIRPFIRYWFNYHYMAYIIPRQ